MLKVSQIILWLKSHIGAGYVYGTIGQTCTVDLLRQKQVQYGVQMGNGYYQLNGDYTKGRCGRWLNKWVCDCSGLIKIARKALSGVWQDVSAQGTYDQCGNRGAIGSMPLTPGCTVYMYSKDKGRMSHVGMYIGGGLVVEARGVDYGVVTTRLSDRAWTHWGLLDWLVHDVAADTGKAVAGGAADAGDASNPKPDDAMPYEQAVDIISQKAGISKEYWLRKKDIEPNFSRLMVMIATAMEG